MAVDEPPMEILILDDMEADRMRLKRLCEKAGLSFRCREADSIHAFRKSLDGPQYDILLIDYSLGDGTGLDALEAMKSHERQSGATAILVSSIDDLDIAIEAMRLGCADYINKEDLSVEALRKSLALAFERRLLLSSLSDAQASEKAMRLMLSRIARTSGQEIRSVIGATLKQVRTLTGGMATGEVQGLSASLERLDRLCGTLGRYLDVLGREIERAEGDVAPIGPRVLDLDRT